MSEFRTKRIALKTVNLKVLPSDLVRLKSYQSDGDSLACTLNKLLNQLEDKDEI